MCGGFEGTQVFLPKNQMLFTLQDYRVYILIFLFKIA